MNAPAHHNRITPGPQVGAPPSLENVPIDRLTVDPTYQRATDSPASRRILIGMVKKWDWSLCQPLIVSRRADGSLLILDGQHRHAGAKERGDIPFLPCTLLSSLDLEGEARTFVELNTKRQRLTQAEVFHGMLAAGDEQAKAVAEMIEQTGWTVRKGSNTATYKAGDLECAPMLVKTFDAKGAAPVRFALDALRAAYPDTPVRQSSTMLKALFDVFDRLCDDPALAAVVPTNALIAAIGAVEPETWMSRGVIHRSTRPAVSMTAAIAATMLAAAQGKDVPTMRPHLPKAAPVALAAKAPAFQMASRPTTAPATAPAVRRPASPATNPFGTTGKGWCTQCEQLRSKPAAAACPSQFCTLRRFT